MLAIPAADFVLHNSLFLIAHFHNVIIGGVVFGVLAGFTYWFPKAMGFRLNERLGKYAFWCWLVGFWTAFMPLYILGFMGATRRLQHYHDLAWQPYFIVAAVGAGIIMLGIIFQILQIVVSIRDREQLKDTTGDPWGGRTLEWATSSPPPAYNFAVTPDVQHLDDFWEQKEEGRAYAKPAHYQPIHMPKNSSAGVFIGIFSGIFGFATIWYIWWLAIVGLVGIVATVIARSFVTDVDYHVPVEEIEATEAAWHKQLDEAKAG
jgi:cytochrome o ubiquinol oxidase subunit 1